MVLMHDAHDAIVKGYLGFDKCYQDLSRGFTCPSMRRDVKEYVRSCDSCQRNKPRNQSQIGLLDPLEVPNRHLEQVTFDFVMELPRTPSGHDAILAIVHRLSKIVHFYPTTLDVDAVGSAKLFFNHWYRYYGFPRKIVSDRDGRFVGKFWQEFFRLTQVRLAMSSSHHPQTDGQTERTNWTMEEMLRPYVNYQQNNWDEVLPALKHAYNTRITTPSMQPPDKCRLRYSVGRSH
jgi:Integrase zinc binding domain